MQAKSNKIKIRGGEIMANTTAVYARIDTDLKNLSLIHI